MSCPTSSLPHLLWLKDISRRRPVFHRVDAKVPVLRALIHVLSFWRTVGTRTCPLCRAGPLLRVHSKLESIAILAAADPVHENCRI
jgi:hypothetical protein